MAGKLQSELGKAHPFESLEQEVFLNIIRTADHLTHGLAEMLKQYNLSPTQYNVLRILRGADAEGGLACREVGQRMITRDPDITRLLDRLEARQLITRCRESADRRVIRTSITPEGLKLLEQIDRPLEELHQRQLSHIGTERLQRLVELLEAARICNPIREQ